MRDGAEDLFIIEQLSQDFLELKKAEYVGYKKRVQQESELLFKPSFRAGIFTDMEQLSYNEQNHPCLYVLRSSQIHGYSSNLHQAA